MPTQSVPSQSDTMQDTSTQQAPVADSAQVDVPTDVATNYHHHQWFRTQNPDPGLAADQDANINAEPRCRPVETDDD